MKKNPQQHHEVAQVGRFGLVGILNTAVDFVILNILSVTVLPKSLTFGAISLFGNSYTITGLVVAGLISGTVAMINSFVFNMRFTFKAKHVDRLHIVYFFLITMFGLYIIRPALLKFFSDVWLWPVNLAYTIGNDLHLPLSQEFFTRNVALAAAISIILVYNYLLYKYVVFSNEKK